MDGQAAESAPARSWWTVAVLFLLSSVAWMDRSVISMVIGPIRAHFGIGDFQVSLLIGFAFVFFYILLLVPIGWLADRYSRKVILYAGVTIWSVASALCGVAGSYAQLFAARMLVGAGEGCVSPVAAAVISRNFGRARMAAPMALYSLGTSAGTAAGAVAAGYILAWGAAAGPVALPMLGTVAPWQLVFILLGVPGIAIALLAFTIHDPEQPAAPRPSRESGGMAFIRAHPRTFISTVLGFIVINVAVTSVMTWTPEYLHRRFGAEPAETGWAIGIVSLAAPLACQAGIGFVVDRLVAGGMTDAPLRVMRWLLIAALPLAAGLWLASSFTAYLFFMFGLMAVLFPSNPLGITAVQMIAPSALRSQLAAVHLAALGIVGIGFGSSVVGFVSQYWLGETQLGAAMTLVVLAAVCGAFALLSAGLRPTRETVARLQTAAR